MLQGAIVVPRDKKGRATASQVVGLTGAIEFEPFKPRVQRVIKGKDSAPSTGTTDGELIPFRPSSANPGRMSVTGSIGDAAAQLHERAASPSRSRPSSHHASATAAQRNC